MNPRRALGGAVWLALLIVVTATLRWLRTDVEQSHVSLVLLLLVVGGSAAAGRALGFTLAAIATVFLDYFFQPPYDRISVSKPLDWVVLVAFFAIAFAVTELLTRARAQAAASEARARDVESLARAGAESLRYAAPAHSLAALALLTCDSLGTDRCLIFSFDRAQAGPRLEAASDDVLDASPTLTSLVQRATEGDAFLGMTTSGVVAIIPADARTGLPLEPMSLLALPLHAESRLVGAMAVQAGSEPLLLDEPRHRLVRAFGFYAALALERARLHAVEAKSEQLREVQHAKEQLFASVSHDLGTPLTTIKALAQAGVARGEQSSLAIAEQADRMARMVADLLDVSRLRTGSVALQPALNTAEDLIGATLRRAEGIRGEHRILTPLDLDAPALVGQFDFVQSLRALGNLVDNALRYSAPGSVIEVGCVRDGRWLAFSVADRGAGVPDAERSRIFDAFYRPANALPDTGRAGLGLSIARSLAELQGGSVEYAPRAGGGSEFTLRLPAVDVDPAESELDGPDDELASLSDGLVARS